MLEFYQAEADVRQTGEGYRLSVHLTVYAVVPLGAAVVLPDHQAHGAFRWAELDLGGTIKVNLIAGSQPLISPLIFGGSLTVPGSEHSNDSRTNMVHQGDQQVILEGPGFFRFVGESSSLPINFALDKPCPLEITFSARPAGSDLSATVQKILLPCDDLPGGLDAKVAARWR